MFNSPPMPKLKILIIDDEEDYCMILEDYFLQKKYEVYLAYTLREGVQLLQHNKIDFLFLDNNLPDGNGWQIVDKLITEMPDLKIYLISAYKQKNDFVGTSPRVTVWEKPISFDLLESIPDNPDKLQAEQKESM